MKMLIIAVFNPSIPILFFYFATSQLDGLEAANSGVPKYLANTQPSKILKAQQVHSLIIVYVDKTFSLTSVS